MSARKLQLFLKRPQFWVICALLALMPLFQNMSPLGEDFDLKAHAPVKPEGYQADPNTRWVPTHLGSATLDGVGSRILQHNFDPWVKNLEGLTIQQWNGTQATVFSFENGEAHLLGIRAPTSEVPIRLSLMSPEHLRLRIDHLFRFSCDMKSGEPGAEFGVSKDLTSKMHLQMSHRTHERQSQIQMQMDW